MRGESGFVTIFIGDFDLPIAAIRLQYRKIRGITKAVDLFIDSWCGIIVLEGYSVQPVVFYKKSGGSVFCEQTRSVPPTLFGPVKKRPSPTSCRFRFSLFPACGPGQYGVKWVGCLPAEFNLIRCLDALI